MSESLKRALKKGLRRSLIRGIKFAFAFALAQAVIGGYKVSYYVPDSGPSLAVQVIQYLASGFVAGFGVNFLLDLIFGKLKNEE